MKYALLSQGTGYLQNFTSGNIETGKLKTGECLKLSYFDFSHSLRVRNRSKYGNSRPSRARTQSR